MNMQDLQQFADSSVDAVTCTFGLMFMPNWQKAVKEVSSVALFSISCTDSYACYDTVLYLCTFMV
jgi:Methyltransferase domain